MKCPGEGKIDTTRCKSFSEIGSGGLWSVRKSGVMDVAEHSLPQSSSVPPMDAYGPLLGQWHPQLSPFSDLHNQESVPSPNPFLHRPHLVGLQVLGTPLPKCLSIWCLLSIPLTTNYIHAPSPHTPAHYMGPEWSASDLTSYPSPPTPLDKVMSLNHKVRHPFPASTEQLQWVSTCFSNSGESSDIL